MEGYVLPFRDHLGPVRMPSYGVPIMAQEKLMTSDQAAAYLQCSRAYLERDRWIAKAAGTPPVIPFLKIGKFVRYRLSDLESIAAGE